MPRPYRDVTNAILARGGSLRSHTPTPSQRLGYWLNKTFHGDSRAGQRKAEFATRTLDTMTGLPMVADALMKSGGELGRGNWRDAPKTLAMAMMPGPAKKGIRAFHGSPHDFDKFSMDRIGTGEGAQAYGHGLYFAENEGVARNYRDQLAASAKPGSGGLLVNGRHHTELPPEQQQAVLDYWTTRNPEVLRGTPLENAVIDAAPAGKMYEVSINADPEQFLDWDAPLSQQPEPIRQLGSAQKNRPLVDTDTGRDIYNKNTQGLSSDTASQRMKQAGIPGIKYLDQGSRGVQILSPQETVHGEWLVKQIPNGNVLYRGPDEAAARAAHDSLTRNYVVFDDSLVSIRKKYGLLPPAFGLGAGLMNNQDQQ